MKVETFSIKYIAVEDRLLIDILMDNKKQYLFWMTRKITKGLLPLLNKYFDKEQAQISSVNTEEEKKEIKNFQHKKMLEDVSFAKNAQDEQTQTQEQSDSTKEDSVETEPAQLLEKIVLKEEDDGKMSIAFLPQDPKFGIKMTITMTFLHGIYQLFINAVKRSDWAIDDGLLWIDANVAAIDKLALTDDDLVKDIKKLN